MATRDALVAALTPANSGRTICVTQSLTGSTITTNAAMTSQTRVLAQPADGTVDMVGLNFGGAKNITVEGFEFTGDRGVKINGGAQAIRYIRNRCHDQTLDCIQLGSSDGTEILANTIQRIAFDGGWPHGYGVDGGNASNLKVNYNLCDMGNISSGDCFQLGTISNFEFIGNDVKNVKGSSASHADGLMVWDNSRNGLIKNNRFVDISTVLLSPDSSDLTIENNLIARAGQRCLDTAQNGSSGGVVPMRWVWRNNTAWSCYFEAIVSAGGGSQQFYNNILEDGGTSGVTAASGNVGRANIGLPNSYTGWSPAWSTTDYQPTNLPTGYGSAGYHPTPVGPAACAC